MIASITKRIRRFVVATPQGDLLVDLNPGGTLTLGIKAKPTTKVTFDLAELFFDSKDKPAESDSAASVEEESDSAGVATGESPAAPHPLVGKTVNFKSTVPGAPTVGVVESIDDTGKALIVAGGTRYPNSVIESS